MPKRCEIYCYYNMFRCMCHDDIFENIMKKHFKQRMISNDFKMQYLESFNFLGPGAAMNSSALRRTSGGTSQVHRLTNIFVKTRPVTKCSAEKSYPFLRKKLTFFHLFVFEKKQGSSFSNPFSEVIAIQLAVSMLFIDIFAHSPDHRTPISHHVLQGDQMLESQKYHQDRLRGCILFRYVLGVHTFRGLAKPKFYDYEQKNVTSLGPLKNSLRKHNEIIRNKVFERLIWHALLFISYAIHVHESYESKI